MYDYGWMIQLSKGWDHPSKRLMPDYVLGGLKRRRGVDYVSIIAFQKLDGLFP